MYYMLLGGGGWGVEDSVVGIVNCYRLDGAGFKSQWE